MPDHDKSRRPKKQFGSHIFPDQEKMWFFIWEWYEKVSNLIRGIRRGDAIGVSDREISREVELRYLQFGIATFRDLTASCLSQALLLSTVTKVYLNLEVHPVSRFIEFYFSIAMRH